MRLSKSSEGLVKDPQTPRRDSLMDTRPLPISWDHSLIHLTVRARPSGPHSTNTAEAGGGGHRQRPFKRPKHLGKLRAAEASGRGSVLRARPWRAAAAPAERPQRRLSHPARRGGRPAAALPLGAGEGRDGVTPTVPRRFRGYRPERDP